ncbi:serine/threonine-protein kinase [Thermomonospora amylolytica]|uniref:hypothetical protein n=1 Tax=Thermomonospora amylolytica TaxID=1411117 RepID=UPI000E6B8694|nr:hypothetical protein [Thermomonospora amylolytica]
MYAATCVFFECVTGARPYPAADLAELRRRHLEDPVPAEAVPEPLRPLLERGMAKDPAARPMGAAAFVTELEAVAGGAYGPDWETRGWGALGVATAAVLPLAMAALATGGAAGAAVAAGAGAGTSAAGQGILATTAAKVTAAVAVTATVAGAGVGAYEVVADEPPPVVRQVSLSTPTLERTIPVTGRPAIRVLGASYLQVSGLADRAVQDRANQALRAPLDNAITSFRRYMAGEHQPTSPPRCAELDAEVEVRLGGPRLVSVVYRFDTRTCSVADEDPGGFDAVTVDLDTGRAVTVDDLFRPGSIDRLSERLPPPTPDSGECGYDLPLRRDRFAPGRAPLGHPVPPDILLTLTGTALELRFQSTLPCPAGHTETLPLDRVRDLLRPQVLAALTTAPTPERS